MAILHEAELSPTKLELLETWLPEQPWYRPARAKLTRVAAYRFDDPDGEVGVETLLVRSEAGPLVQAPLTYRGAPLASADEWLIGTMEHSVLGHRWVYDACGDPVYAAVLAHAILSGSSEAAEEVAMADGRVLSRKPSMSVRGSGSAGPAEPAALSLVEVRAGDPIRIRSDSVDLTVPRLLDRAVGNTGDPFVLRGTWPGQNAEVVLASARPLR